MPSRRRWPTPHPAAKRVAGATAYVTLEPCCHLNKKTPPCAPRLIAAGVARVVIGCFDPNPAVNGRGVAMLREAGIAVDGPLLEAECKQLIAPFLARVNLGRPYVTLKWAESSDGRVAGPRGEPVHITSAASDRQVHLLRSRCDAIAVGTNTVLSDDPLLTARNVPHLRPLMRVIFSNTLEKISPTSRLVQTARESPVLLFCSQAGAVRHREQAETLRAAGVEVVGLADAEGHFRMTDAIAALGHRDVTHLMIEPGPTLARSLLARGPADRVWVFRSPGPLSHEEGSRSSPVEWPPSGSILAGRRFADGVPQPAERRILRTDGIGGSGARRRWRLGLNAPQGLRPRTPGSWPPWWASPRLPPLYRRLRPG